MSMKVQLYPHCFLCGYVPAKRERQSITEIYVLLIYNIVLLENEMEEGYSHVHLHNV